MRKKIYLVRWGKRFTCKSACWERIYLVCLGKGSISILCAEGRDLFCALEEGIYLACLGKGFSLCAERRDLSCVLGEGIYLVCLGKGSMLMGCLVRRGKEFYKHLTTTWQILASFKLFPVYM